MSHILKPLLFVRIKLYHARSKVILSQKEFDTEIMTPRRVSTMRNVFINKLFFAFFNPLKFSLVSKLGIFPDFIPACDKNNV